MPGIAERPVRRRTPPRSARRRQAQRRRPSRNWRAILGLRRADALWLRDRLIPCAVLALVTGAFAFLLRSPLFVVHTVRVQGAPAALTTAVVRAAGINNQSLFALNPQQLAARILTIPDLQSARVSLNLPNAMTINVLAYQPVAVWVSAGKSYLVTEDGTVIKPGDDANLLHVTDNSGHAYAHGDHIAPATVRAAFTLRDLLAGQQISGGDYTFLVVHSLSIRSMAGAPGPRAGGPEMTAAWNAVSLRLRTAAIRPSRLSNRRKTVPFPTPARAAIASVVTASTPYSSISDCAAARSASRLRAASLRSGGGSPRSGSGIGTWAA